MKFIIYFYSNLIFNDYSNITSFIRLSIGNHFFQNKLIKIVSHNKRVKLHEPTFRDGKIEEILIDTDYKADLIRSFIANKYGEDQKTILL